MIAKRNEFVKKTAGHRVGNVVAEGCEARGYGNPYFKKGLEKLRHRGEGRKTERILISLENEEKTF